MVALPAKVGVGMLSWGHCVRMCRIRYAAVCRRSGMSRTCGGRAGRRFKKYLRLSAVFYYTTRMALIFSVKRVSKQNKGKKCSCALACNLAETD